MSFDTNFQFRLPRGSERCSRRRIIPSRSSDGHPKQRNLSFQDVESFQKIHDSLTKIQQLEAKNVCLIHKQKYISVCAQSRCPKRGVTCPTCQVKFHHEHLGNTWNLEDYLRQVKQAVTKQHPITFELNDYFIEIKNKIRQTKQQIIEQIEKIDVAVNRMTKTAKENFDKDIDDVKTNLKLLENNPKIDITSKLKQITQYFGIDPETHEVYMSTAYKELYNWKIAKLLQDQIDTLEQFSVNVLHLFNEIVCKFNKFTISRLDNYFEDPKFQPQNLQVCQTIEMAHSNWIRSCSMFTLSELEEQNLDLINTAQIAKRDPYNLQGLQAIVTTGDDMEVKIWVYFPEQAKFKMLSQIIQAHQKEFLALRVYYCEQSLLSGMVSGQSQCNNIIFTAEHGLIKVWDWVQRKCLNEIKTYSIFTYDFEVLKFPTIGICFALGSKNTIQISDFTSPGGMLSINEIYPIEQNKEITAFKRIDQGQTDILVASFSTSPGVIKVYNHHGQCLCRIVRQDKDMAFCLENLMNLKKSQKQQVSDVIVVGSDSGVVTAYQLKDGKTLWMNQHVHTSWVRGLSSLVVKDNYHFKTLVLSQGENEHTIKILDGLTGQLIYETKEILDAGLRYRGLAVYQVIPDPKQPDSSVVVAGTIKGTLVILKILEQ